MTLTPSSSPRPTPPSTPSWPPAPTHSPTPTSTAPTSEDRLRAVAATQGGSFTYADARDCGWSDAAARSARETGAWRQLERGRFCERQLWEAMAPEERHLTAVRARLLVVGPGWHAARRSAALAHGLPLLGGPPPRPQLVRGKERLSDRARNRFERRTTLTDEETCTTSGVPATALARTAVDFGRGESFRSGVVVADAVLGRGVDREVLLAQARRCGDWPGGVQGLRVARFADGLSESAFESISRVRMDQVGLPAPELQINVYLGEVLLGRVDFLWRAFNLVGEADGRWKYGEDPGRSYAEKLREERLEDAGLEVANWSWDSAWRADGDLEAKIRRGMARGLRNTLDPRVRFVPTTVADRLRRAG